jgi:hypothetical protein
MKRNDDYISEEPRQRQRRRPNAICRFNDFSADLSTSQLKRTDTIFRNYRLRLCLFEMMNEGLDALATLASTSPSAPTWGDSGLNRNNYSSQRTNGNQFSANGPNGNTATSTSNGSTAATPADSQPLFSASNLMHMLQNGSLSQLQQALQQCGNGMNPSSLSNSNLALLMGMQQQQSQPQSHPQSDQLALLQQQLSYYRGNMNSQSGNSMNGGTGNNRGIQQMNTTSFEPHQALALSQALQAHQRSQQTGKSIIEKA